MRLPSPTRTALCQTCLAGGIIAGSMVGASSALAQGLAGSTVSATISQRIEADTNYDLDDPSPGTSYFGDTRLAVGVLSDTETSSFALDFDTGLRALWEADEPFEFTVASPSTARVGYIQDWADASIDTFVRYRQRRVDTEALAEDFDDDGLADNLDQLDGEATERRYDAGLDLELATDAPSSYFLNLSATHFDYSDDDTDEVPRTSVTTELAWTLRLTPILSSAVTANYLYYDADDPEETRLTIAEVDAGFIYEPSEVLRIGVGLGYANRQRDETINGVRERTEDEQGPVARATINYAFEDFTIAGSGRVTTAAPDTRFNGFLRAAYPLPRGELIGRVFQSYTGASGGEEVKVTGAGFGVTREITTLSSIAFDVAAARQENQDDPDDPDVRRFDATATYSYAFADNLAADIGYRYRHREEDPDKADSHAIFFEIGRTFETRP